MGASRFLPNIVACSLAISHTTAAGAQADGKRDDAAQNTIVYGQLHTPRVGLARLICDRASAAGATIRMGPWTPGSATNVQLVADGQAAFGLGQADTLSDMQPRYPDIHVLAAFGGEFLQVFVSDEVYKASTRLHRSPLETLRGWRAISHRTPIVNTGARGSGSKGTSKSGGIFLYFGLRPEDPAQPTPNANCLSDNSNHSEIIAACERRAGKLVDAYMFVSEPTSDVGEHLLSSGFHLVDLDDGTLNGLTGHNRYWTKGTIAAGQVSALQTYAARAVQIPLVLFTSARVSQAMRSAVLSAVYSPGFNAAPYRLVDPSSSEAAAGLITSEVRTTRGIMERGSATAQDRVPATTGSATGAGASLRAMLMHRLRTILIVVGAFVLLAWIVPTLMIRRRGKR